jgi:hypothetical protein
MSQGKFISVLQHALDDHGVLVLEHPDIQAAEDYLSKWRDSPEVRDVHIIAWTPSSRGGFWDCPISTVYARRFDKARAGQVIHSIEGVTG